MDRLKRSEGDEQEALFEWAEWNLTIYPELKLMYHIPNGGYRNKSEAAKLKKQGVKKGVPDICLPAPRGKFHGLYIELKTDDGKASKDQIEYIKALNRTGYAAEIAHGFEQAVEIITRYLEIKGA